MILFNQAGTALASPRTNCTQLHPSINDAAGGLFSPVAALYDGGAGGMRVRSSSDQSLLLRWAGFAFGRARRRRRVGGQQGVAPSPAPPSTRLRLGGSSQGRAVSAGELHAAKLERSNFSWGFILF